MENNTKQFILDLADLMEKHQIEYFRAADHGMGCLVYFRGGWKNGIWLDPEEITPSALRDALQSKDE